VPRESFDAPENLPQETPRQVALGQLQDEVSRMPDEAPAGLDQPLLQARSRPTLNGEGQNKSAQEIAEIVRDDAQEQPHLIGMEAVTGEPSPVVVKERTAMRPVSRRMLRPTRPCPIPRAPNRHRLRW
jgi:hypothetical protein